MQRGDIFIVCFLCWEKETGVWGWRAVVRLDTVKRWIRLASPQWFFGLHPFFAIQKKGGKEATGEKDVKPAKGGEEAEKTSDV